ncbi:MAG: hypothetical protein A7315_05970 [Candidatus Altiarchaeales archaeon WOR_SM1_79]|nr:MAG: hypothetical protein A7315_05970 [Candidatus Altiarchaeales archaeon WOR_SM1_79]
MVEPLRGIAGIAGVMSGYALYKSGIVDKYLSVAGQKGSDVAMAAGAVTLLPTIGIEEPINVRKELDKFVGTDTGLYLASTLATFAAVWAGDKVIPMISKYGAGVRVAAPIPVGVPRRIAMGGIGAPTPVTGRRIAGV